MKKSILLCIGVLLLSLLALDAVFSLYEKRFLIHALSREETYDLLAMGYNDEGVYAREKPEKIYRILSFGGSFTFGITRPDFTFNAVLGRDLAKLFPGRSFEILNLGSPGAGFRDMLAQFEFWSNNIDYDAAIFTLYPGANFEARPKDKRKELVYGPGVFVPQGAPFRMFDYLSTIAAAVDALRREKDPVYFSAFPFPYDAYVAKMAKASRPYRMAGYEKFTHGLSGLWRLMEAVKAETRRGKRALFVVAGPHFLYSPELFSDVLQAEGIDRGRIDPLLPGAVIRALAQKIGLSGDVLDLTPCLATVEDGGKSLYYKTDTHWSREGNQLVGEVLADDLTGRWFGEIKGGSAVCPGDAPAPDQARDGFVRDEAQRVAAEIAAGGR